jgi:hypothetical protein
MEQHLSDQTNAMDEERKSSEFQYTFDEAEEFLEALDAPLAAKGLRMGNEWERSVSGRYLALRKKKSRGGQVTQERARAVRQAELAFGKTPSKMPYERATDARMAKCAKRKEKREQEKRESGIAGIAADANDRFIKRCEELAGIGKLSKN